MNASWLEVDALSTSKNHISVCKFSDEDSSDYKNVLKVVSVDQGY